MLVCVHIQDKHTGLTAVGSLESDVWTSGQALTLPLSGPFCTFQSHFHCGSLQHNVLFYFCCILLRFLSCCNSKKNEGKLGFYTLYILVYF